MPNQCPVCSRLNPSEAFYCFYDGRLLSSGVSRGPLQLGFAPFATPFYFADGQVCANFNQLALTCNSRWDEARGLLVQGIWPTFFSSIGRLDLAASAQQAAASPDLDRALGELLAKFPADADSLQPPKLDLDSNEENLGQLMPGADLTFELVVRNKGMLLLHGTVASNCDWLVFGDRTGPTQRMFQTRGACAIPVRVLGHKLRAGLQPLTAEIVVETNGGTRAVPVIANVPIRPFPKGLSPTDALAGAKSPRDIAVKSKGNPLEAAALFAQGAVKAWYASNGWVYPIEGSEGSGKGAVQQFFEALGLTKPPRLEVDTTPLVLKGRIGERIGRRVIVRTAESKPVYAQAWSNQPWVTFAPVKYLGNKVEIRVEITVPPFPEQTVQAQVTIQGNGKQRFVLPISVAIAKGRVPVAMLQGTEGEEESEFEEDSDDFEANHEEDDPSSWGDWFNRLWK